MNTKKIVVPLSINGVKNALKEIRQYQRSIIRKQQKLLRRLSDIGIEEAKIRFATASYPQVDNDVQVNVIPITNGYKIIANGQAVCFIEFGAGVTYNSNGGNYPTERPNGIVGIGEYGRGQGANPKGWFYTDSQGNSKHTYGNHAEMPMYCASKEMREQILEIATEVFGTDD